MLLPDQEPRSPQQEGAEAEGCGQEAALTSAHWQGPLGLGSLDTRVRPSGGSDIDVYDVAYVTIAGCTAGVLSEAAGRRGRHDITQVSFLKVKLNVIVRVRITQAHQYHHRAWRATGVSTSAIEPLDSVCR